MEPCIQSASVTGPCLMCGGRAEKMHQPLFHRGSFCPRCCPVCAPVAAAPAPVVAAVLASASRTTKPAARGTTQWKDAGWGPRPDDPFYHDRERRNPSRRGVCKVIMRDGVLLPGMTVPPLGTPPPDPHPNKMVQKMREAWDMRIIAWDGVWPEGVRPRFQS